MNHIMSPTGVAVLLLLALVVDWMSFGPNSIRDRIAFLLALPAIRQGFDGSPLDQWTVGALSSLIDGLKAATGGAYIAGAVTSVLLGAIIGILAIYTIGALLPNKMSGKLGQFATISFPASGLHRLNYRLWTCAVVLGLLADLPGGVIGNALRSIINAVTTVVSLLPNVLFGAS